MEANAGLGIRGTSAEKDMLLNIYGLKVGYLSNQFNRMWTRFNYFLTIESALIGGKFLITNTELTWGLALVGAVLSGIWYVFGAQDRYLVLVYREDVKRTAKRLAELTSVDFHYINVGETDPEVDWNAQQPTSISGWRIESISITRLAALFPVVLFVAWLITLAVLRAQ